MSIFKCKMCGGTLEIQPGETVAECEYCGTKQTLPKLDDGRKANLFDRANHFRRNNEFDKAAGIYEQILNEDHTDAETYWSLVLCRYGIEYVEDPATHKRVPTVNRAQFTSIFDDDNYKSALNYADGYQRSIYEDEAKAINEIQKGILAISQKEEPFDVFICYKETDNAGRRTPDSVLATDLYHQLTQEGFKVFFSRITLEDKLGSAYEPYIFAALNSAKVMVVLGTRPEYFNAVWVKNEWSRYLALIKAGAKKMLIPAYKDMDPYDLPEEFSHLQALDMSKLGFMQDLIRGIKKILAEDAPKSAAKETVVVNAGATNTAALLKRAFMFLEDGDWKSADEYCEKVLDQDPENAQAYVGKLMAELRVRKQADLRDCRFTFTNRNSYQKILRFGDKALCDELKGYIRHIEERNEQERLKGLYEAAAGLKAQAKSEEDYKKAAEAFAEVPGYRDADSQKQECLELAEAVRKDAIYENAAEIAKSDSVEALEDAIGQFQTVSGWKDADAQIRDCQQRIETLKAEEEAKRLEQERLAELRKKEAAEQAKRNKKIAAIGIPIGVVLITFLIVLNTVIIPNSKYSSAVALMDAGQYEEAIAVFSALNGHKDSAQKVAECQYQFAVTLMDAGKYEEAIAAFSALNGHKDSAQKISDCETAMLDAQYDAALVLMDAGQYEEAISAFSALDGHKDSEAQIADCQYSFALALIDAKKYEEAYDVLVGLGAYKNAEEVLRNFKTVYQTEIRYHGYRKDITEYSYDAAGNCIKEVITYFDGDKATGEYSYDAAGNCIKKIYNNSDGKRIYEYSYDAAGNCIKEVETWPSGYKDITEYSYDAAGNCIKKVYTYADGDKANTTEYSYDAAGNCIKEVITYFDGDKAITEYSYDAAGNCIKEIITNSSGSKVITEYSYDPAGNCIKKIKTNSDGKIIYEYSYDAAGNCIKQVVTASNGEKSTYEYSYDAAGNCIKKVVTYSDGDKDIYEYSYEDRLVFYIPAE